MLNLIFARVRGIRSWVLPYSNVKVERGSVEEVDDAEIGLDAVLAVRGDDTVSAIRTNSVAGCSADLRDSQFTGRFTSTLGVDNAAAPEHAYVIREPVVWFGDDAAEGFAVGLRPPGKSM